ncbi:hypothetical protein IWX85_003759 [Polaromonas sp. CG_9.11]|nr:hypothetical protein [Polaromonas sp. CG_9.11]
MGTFTPPNRLGRSRPERKPELAGFLFAVFFIAKNQCSHAQTPVFIDFSTASHAGGG